MEFQERCARSMSIQQPSSSDRRFSTPGLKPALKRNSSSFSSTKSQLAKSLSLSSSSANLVRFDTHVEEIVFQAECPASVRSSVDHQLASDSLTSAEDLGFMADIGSMMELASLAVQAFMAMFFTSKAQTKAEYRSDTRILTTLVRYCRTLFSIIVLTASFTKRITLTPSYQYRQIWKHRSARVSKRTIRFE